MRRLDKQIARRGQSGQPPSHYHEGKPVRRARPVTREGQPMPNFLIHAIKARRTLARDVARLAAAIRRCVQKG